MKHTLKHTFMASLVCCALCASPAIAEIDSGEPLLTDSRIKTFVYSENDVFNVLTHYGYQSNIEFAKNEEIQTISVGDRVGWQIIPAGQRLFIRALEESVHTNMTVVTSKRAYQFDLRSSGAGPLHPSEELVYVARFFYPGESKPSPHAKIPVPIVQPIPTAVQAPPPVIAPTPVATAAPIVPVAAAAPVIPVNYEYTYSGPDDIAPLKIFDDGSSTYFKLPVSAISQPPSVYALDAAGRPTPVRLEQTSDGFARVNVIAERFALRQGTNTVTVYNERML